MEPTLHISDAEINRQEDPFGDPLPTFHYSQTQDLPYTLAIDVGVLANYISFELAGHLKSNICLHPKPYVMEDGHRIISQCRLPFRVGSYEDELLCDIINIKSVSVILGCEWITNRQIRYNRRKKILHLSMDEEGDTTIPTRARDYYGAGVIAGSSARADPRDTY